MILLILQYKRKSWSNSSFFSFLVEVSRRRKRVKVGPPCFSRIYWIRLLLLQSFNFIRNSRMRRNFILISWFLYFIVYRPTFREYFPSSGLKIEKERTNITKLQLLKDKKWYKETKIMERKKKYIVYEAEKYYYIENHQ